MVYEVWYDVDDKSWYLSTAYFTESYDDLSEVMSAIKTYEKEGV